MPIAIIEAKKAASRGEVPVGALIEINGEIISSAGNRTRELKDPTAHAEILVIRNACSILGVERLIGANLYVTLEPCPMCAGAAFWTRIGRIVYGASDLKRGYKRWEVGEEKKGHGGANSENGLLHPTTMITSGILEQECSKLVKDFFQSKRKRL